MPRSFAAGLLNRLETSNHNLDEVLAVEFSRREEMTGVRRHRAKLLVSEVIRRRATLDQILKVYSSRKPDEMEHHVRTVLRMALAEWFFIEPQPPRSDDAGESPSTDARLRDGDADPDDDTEDRHGRNRRGRGRNRRGRREPSENGSGQHSPVPRGPIAAAAVSLVGSNRPSRGFVNGVLRAIDRDTRYIADGIIAPDDFVRDRIPAAGGGVYHFGREIFADAEKKPHTWLSQYASLPKWLTKRFIARYGLPVAREVADACNSTPALSIRVNVRKVSPDDLREEMAEAGIETRPTDLPDVLHVRSGVPLVNTPWFEDGEIYLQDVTAARAGHALHLEPGMKILDACAAPGGKIMHACEILDGQGTFVAVDVSERRLRRLRENLDRLGHGEVAVQCADFREFAEKSDATFDVIFVDAPCSNTGVLARRADVRWRITEDTQKSLIGLQRELLAAAQKRLAPGGRLVYSTCTIEPEENRGVVVSVPGLELVGDELWLPESGRYDGGYCAVLKRASD